MTEWFGAGAGDWDVLERGVGGILAWVSIALVRAAPSAPDTRESSVWP